MQQQEDINIVKVKQGLDPLGQAAKKQKEELNQNQQQKQQKGKLVLNNTFNNSDSKDLFSYQIPQDGQKRTVNFATSKIQEPKKPAKVLDFGISSSKTVQANKASQQAENIRTQKKIHENLFGTSETSQQQQQVPQQQSRQLQFPNKSTLKEPTNNNISNMSSSNNNGNKSTVQLNPPTTTLTKTPSYENSSNYQQQNLEQPQVYNEKQTLQFNIEKNKQQIIQGLQDDKMLLLKLGVEKEEYIQGESHITHSEVSLKLYDKYQEQYKFFDGILILTSYALRFVPLQERKQEVLKNIERYSYFLIPLGFLTKLSRSVEKKGIIYSYLEIQTKDYREYLFRFSFSQQIESNDFLTKIQRIAFPEDKNQLFAFNYNLCNREMEDAYKGWDIFNWQKEFKRMGVKIAPLTMNLDNYSYERTDNEVFEFRYIDNSQGQICSTYPPILAVPFQMSDDLIIKSARFRSRERLASLSYAKTNPYNNQKNKYISLWRCSQCKTGLQNNRSYEDEKFFRIIGDSYEPIDKSSNSSYYNCHIFDARPKINAVGMQLAGKGFESIDFYKNCQISFLNIGNIHKVREAQKLLVKALTSDQTKYLSYLEKSGYYEMLASIIEGAVKIVQKLGQGINVVTHCSDGWDRTGQLCSLVQILMDPYYRTIEGFQCLIEKEWVNFGFQFGVRCGHGNKNYQEEQRSPVFTQFLDCVHQVMNQYPLSFEFNQKFLVDINYHLYSCQFGTFLCNHYQEQKQYNIKETTISLWSYMNQPELREQYLNTFYDDKMQIQELEPDSSIMGMKLWKECYLYYTHQTKDRYKMYMGECTFNEENMNFMHKLAKFKNEQLQKLLEQKDSELNDIMKEYNQKLKAREDIIDQYENQLKKIKQANNQHQTIQQQTTQESQNNEQDDSSNNQLQENEQQQQLNQQIDTQENQIIQQNEDNITQNSEEQQLQ